MSQKRKCVQFLKKPTLLRGQGSITVFAGFRRRPTGKAGVSFRPGLYYDFITYNENHIYVDRRRHNKHMRVKYGGVRRLYEISRASGILPVITDTKNFKTVYVSSLFRRVDTFLHYVILRWSAFFIGRFEEYAPHTCHRSPFTRNITLCLKGVLQTGTNDVARCRVSKLRACRAGLKSVITRCKS